MIWQAINESDKGKEKEGKDRRTTEKEGWIPGADWPGLGLLWVSVGVWVGERGVQASRGCGTRLDDTSAMGWVWITGGALMGRGGLLVVSNWWSVLMGGLSQASCVDHLHHY